MDLYTNVISLPGMPPPQANSTRLQCLAFQETVPVSFLLPPTSFPQATLTPEENHHHSYEFRPVLNSSTNLLCFSPLSQSASGLCLSPMLSPHLSVLASFQPFQQIMLSKHLYSNKIRTGKISLKDNNKAANIEGRLGGSIG